MKKFTRDRVVPTISARVSCDSLGSTRCVVSSCRTEGSVENLVGWVKGSFLQAATVFRSRRSRAAAARVADGHEHGPALAGDLRAAGGGHRRGAHAVAAAQDRADRSGAPPPGQCESAGRGDARRPPVLDAPGRDRPAGHVVISIGRTSGSWRGASAPSTRGNSSRARAPSCRSIVPSASRRCGENGPVAICRASVV